jgi:hypothetical protein
MYLIVKIVSLKKKYPKATKLFVDIIQIFGSLELEPKEIFATPQHWLA